MKKMFGKRGIALLTTLALLVSLVAMLSGLTMNVSAEGETKTITIDDKSFTAEAGKWAYNDSAVTSTNAKNYSMLIYDGDYTGTVSVNGYGAAIVLDQYGVLVKIYDAANGGFYTEEGKAATAGFSTATYATDAYNALEDGELLIVFPNDGVNSSTSARTWALGLRGVSGARAYCGESATLTGFTFEDPCAEGHDYVEGECTVCGALEPLTLTIGSNSIEVDAASVAVDNAATAVGSYVFFVYTPAYTGTTHVAGGWGEAIVVDQYGKIVRIYDGVNGKYYDAEIPAGATGAGCTAAGYAAEAFASRQAGETVIVAPQTSTNATRSFLYSNRTVGATVSGLGLTFETDPCADGHDFVEGECADCGEPDPNYDPCDDGHDFVEGECTVCGEPDPDYDPCANGHDFEEGECTVCGEPDPNYVPPMSLTIGSNSFDVDSNKVAVDQQLTAIGSYAFIVYTSDYTGTLGFTNGYGEAIVVNKYGKIVRIYDGASGKYYDVSNPNGVQDGTCTSAGYAAEAFASLQDGETLIIAPNDGGANASRGFLYGNRTVGAVVSGLGLTFETDPCADGTHNYQGGVCADCGEEEPDNKTITVGDKSFTAVEGKWAYNDSTVTSTNAANYQMIIYDGDYEGSVALNGWGAAIVLDKHGVLVKIYDGANGGFWTEEGKSAGSLTFDTSNYATVAFNELEDGELLIVFPNDGANGSTSPRTWALGLRNVGGDPYCGELATLTGFTFICLDGEHDFVEGVCTECGEEDPDYRPAQTGDIDMIPVVIMGVMAIAAMAVLTLNKKKFSV